MITDQPYNFKKFSKQSRSDCNADSPPLTLGLTHHWRRAHRNLSRPPRCVRRGVQLPLWELRWVKTRGQEDSLRSVILNMPTSHNTKSHDRRGDICHSRHCRWQCKLFFSGVNFFRKQHIVSHNQHKKLVCSFIFAFSLKSVEQVHV